jgi:Cu(I)/Ag(I) efflux system membrane protein CusA/SilA
MLIYLRQAAQETPELSRAGEATLEIINHTIHKGATLRVRPKAMTVGTVLVSLIPMFWSQGTGSEVIRRIAAPLMGGMLTAFTLSMFIIPTAFKIKLSWQAKRLAKLPKRPNNMAS